MSDLAPNARIPCSRCGRPCRAHLTQLCRSCFHQTPTNRRPSLNQTGWRHHPQKTGTTNVNAAKERNFDSPLSRRKTTDAQAAAEAAKAAKDAAKVRRLVEKRARTPQERSLLERMLGVGKDQ